MKGLKELMDLLNADNYYVKDEYIDIAKGKYKSPQNWKEFKNVIRRR